MKKEPRKLSFSKRVWEVAQMSFGEQEFETDMEKFRKKWNIDEAGLSGHTYLDWSSDLYYDSLKQIQDMVPYSERKTELQKIRRQVEAGTALMQKNKPSVYLTETDLCKFWFGLDAIRRKHRMPPRWSKGLYKYAIKNDMSTVFLPGDNKVRIHFNVLGEPEEVSVTYDAYAGKADVLETWVNSIKPIRKRFVSRRFGKIMPSNDYQIGKVASQLKENGEKNAYIAKELDIASFEVDAYIAKYRNRKLR